MTQTEALKLALAALQDFDYDKRIAAITAIKEALAQPEQETNKNGSPCPEFWDWLPKAYNFEGDGNFTKYNMEVAFLAGKQASQPEQEPVAWISHNAGLYHFKPDQSLDPLPLYLAPPPCPTCEALARTVMLDQTSHDATPPERKPLTDKQILADETLRYYFGQNGGAGPVSKQGRKVVNAIEALHEIKEVKSCGS